jgi:hypothetical protein
VDEHHPQEPFTIRFPNIFVSAGLLALGSSIRLLPSHQGFPGQWFFSVQPMFPITAAGPLRFFTVFRNAETIVYTNSYIFRSSIISFIEDVLIKKSASMST